MREGDPHAQRQYGQASGKRKASQAANRAKLLQAAKLCFEEKGYEATGTRHIAERAGLSTGAIFVSWPGKAELYAEVYGHPPITAEQGRALLAVATAVLDFGDGLHTSDMARAAIAAVRQPALQAKAA